MFQWLVDSIYSCKLQWILVIRMTFGQAIDGIYQRLNHWSSITCKRKEKKEEETIPVPGTWCMFQHVQPETLWLNNEGKCGTWRRNWAYLRTLRTHRNLVSTSTCSPREIHASITPLSYTTLVIVSVKRTDMRVMYFAEQITLHSFCITQCPF